MVNKTEQEIKGLKKGEASGPGWIEAKLSITSGTAVLVRMVVLLLNYFFHLHLVPTCRCV